MAGHLPNIIDDTQWQEKNALRSSDRSEAWATIYNMYFVYILKSINSPREIYKGYTENLRERLKEHNAGKVSHTSKFRPWKIIFYCCFNNKQKAIQFEKYLKSASGIAFMKKRLIN